MVSAKHSQAIHFLLNDAEVRADAPAGLLALDYLRDIRHLMGTKSGCREGDCGACTVLVGELDAAGSTLRYRPMTSCLLPLGELAGKHLVTIEGLNLPRLSPVQQAMVECGGTQCGFCTPGFIVAMTAGLMEPKLPLDESGVRYAISGNLCRCTGYRSIREAGLRAIEALSSQLQSADRLRDLVAAGALPGYFNDVAGRLRALRPAAGPDEAADTTPSNPAFLIAGGTDLYVQRGHEIPETPVRLLNLGKPVSPATLRDGMIHLDARTTFEALAEDPLIRSVIPAIPEFNLLIASWPIRTRSTLGGNLCNASPIADMTCLLLALDARLVLAAPSGERRTLPLDAFYLGYKQLAKRPDEIVETILFPEPAANTRIDWEKVSKRAWLDIATVNSAARITVDPASGRIAEARLALGGVAPTPLYLRKASQFLGGKPLDPATLREAAAIADAEISPISDVRGSAAYKRLLARQLLLVHFSKLFPEVVSEEALYATH